MIKELPVFPQFTLSSAQGRVGTRKFVLTAEENLSDFIGRACASNWPGDANTVPVLIHVGLQSDPPRISGGIGTSTSNTLGNLLVFGETLVVVQYQFLHLTDAWSAAFPKPNHPTGTTLTLSVKGSGQFLLITPDAVVAYDSESDDPTAQIAADPAGNSTRIIVPITDYLLTCDRLTESQLTDIFAANSWKNLEGTVNEAPFLDEPAECLMFDTWQMDDSFVPDLANPRRWKLTCCLRCRAIPNANNTSASSASPDFFGWNWDFEQGGWKYIRIRTSASGLLEPRYKPVSFENLFGT